MQLWDRLKKLFKKEPTSIPHNPHARGLIESSRPPQFFESVTLEEKYDKSKNLGDFINLIDKK